MNATGASPKRSMIWNTERPVAAMREDRVDGDQNAADSAPVRRARRRRAGSVAASGVSVFSAGHRHPDYPSAPTARRCPCAGRSGQLDRPDLLHAEHHDGDREGRDAEHDRAPAGALDERPEHRERRDQQRADQVDVELADAAGRMVAEAGRDQGDHELGEQQQLDEHERAEREVVRLRPRQPEHDAEQSRRRRRRSPARS